MELVEESVLADPNGSFARREMPDDTVLDLSAYGEHGVIVVFDLLTGPPRFLDVHIDRS